MGAIKKNGKVLWVKKESVHLLNREEAKAFLLFTLAEIERHKRDIEEGRDMAEIIRRQFSIEGTELIALYNAVGIGGTQPSGVKPKNGN